MGVDPSEKISTLMTRQSSKKQMANAVSLIESLSRPILNKKPLENKAKARCLGSWAYTGPGLENEILGKIEKDGVVQVKGSTIDCVWYRVT